MTLDNITNLVEAGSFATEKERQLKRALLELLVKRGHPLYAKRLALLDVVIVPLLENPNMTAAISFDTGTVYISEGFLNCGPQTFNQLDVLMRHELAHNLLMHQIRMLHKFMEIFGVDEETANHIMRSSLHDLLNIIEDYEISNTRYTQADKAIVKNMMLNGRVIGGLVTEEHRAGWQNMSLLQMYDELEKELDTVHAQILSDPAWSSSDMIEVGGAKAVVRYIKINPATDKSILPMAPEKFIKTKAFRKLSSFFQKLTVQILNNYGNGKATETEIINIIKEIQKTSAFKAFNFTDLSGKSIAGMTAYTPEDKMWAINVLLALAGKLATVQGQAPQEVSVETKPDSFVDAYNKIIKAFNNKKFDSKTLAALRRHILQGNVDISFTNNRVGD